MKRPLKKHSKRCNGKMELADKTFAFALYKCNKCSFKSRSYKRRKQED